MDDIVIIIPSYKPETEIMMEFIKKVKNNFKNIVVVDDGSGKEYRDFFANLYSENANEEYLCNVNYKFILAYAYVFVNEFCQKKEILMDIPNEVRR